MKPTISSLPRPSRTHTTSLRPLLSSPPRSAGFFAGFFRQTPAPKKSGSWEASVTAPQLDVQELELEQQPASQERKMEIQEAPRDSEEGTQETPPDPAVETQEAPSDREEEPQKALPDPEEETREGPSDRKEETREAPPDPAVETREGPSDPDEETQEAPSDSEEKTKYIAGLVTGSTDLEGPVGPARQKVTTSESLLLHNVNAHLGSTDARRRKMSSPAKFSADERGRRRGK